MQQSRRHGIIAGMALGALPLLLATGCSFDFSVGDLEAVDTVGAVDAAEVAEKSSAMLAEQVGETPDDFTCSEDLPAEVGAEIRCDLTHGGETLGVTVTTTEVDGSDVKWDIKVDDAPAADTAAEDEAAQDGAAEAPAGDQGGGSAAASDGQVPVSEVVEQSTTALEAAGYSPENLTCSSAYLRAEVGAEISCNFYEGSAFHTATVTATSVDGSTVNWDIKVNE